MVAFTPLFICGVCMSLLAAALYVLKVFKQSALNLPPGPFPLPVIGNLHLLDIRRQDKSLMKISEKYGPVFTVHLGLQKVVVLTGYEAVKDALLNTADVFADRPAIPIFHHIQHGNGVFFSSQELWKTTRRFTVATMRDLGMGKRLGEERMLEELRFLIELIKSFKGGPLPLRFLNMAPTNITFAILFGRRFDYEDPTFLTLLKLIDEVMHLLGSPFLHLFNFYSFLGFLLKPHKMILKKVEEVCVILKKCIKESKENMNENNLMSYIDALVFKQEVSAAVPSLLERGRGLMAFSQHAPGRLIPPYGLGGGSRCPVAEMQGFPLRLSKRIAGSHVVDLPTGTIVWECSREGPVCICPFSPSVCTRVLERGQGQDGYLGLVPCASASAAACRNGSVPHQQHEAGAAGLMGQWYPGPLWLPCGS
ncbi:cytochrome P450 2W1-like isoform X2 [Falco naumanni]|uniref:cytochrome P450 2W1-like isoform X2 n=1 Tax=Falco naumanni TaxID=148594 RepID=UPI001ADE9F09|nr:cytochrome P450 2W1-like isoform X2 [Falco naumanni]